jgi:hypothetical protein
MQIGEKSVSVLLVLYLRKDLALIRFGQKIKHVLIWCTLGLHGSHGLFGASNSEKSVSSFLPIMERDHALNAQVRKGNNLFGASLHASRLGKILVLPSSTRLSVPSIMERNYLMPCVFISVLPALHVQVSIRSSFGKNCMYWISAACQLLVLLERFMLILLERFPCWFGSWMTTAYAVYYEKLVFSLLSIFNSLGKTQSMLCSPRELRSWTEEIFLAAKCGKNREKPTHALLQTYKNLLLILERIFALIRC